MYCMECGAKISEKAKFCPKCGAATDGSAGAEVAARAVGPGKGAVRWGRRILGILLWGLIGFTLTFAWLKVNQLWPERVPFLGLWPGRAEAQGLEFVMQYAPEFSTAKAVVSTAALNGIPYYIVDFVIADSPAGLRLLVSRDLRQVWPYEYLASP